MTMPGPQTRATFGSTLASLPLRYGDFRILTLATVFMGMGYIAESVVLGWLLLERTDSPFVVGLGIALRALPNFLLGIPGGALADRVDRRALLRLGGVAMAANTSVLAALALTDQLAVGSILLFTFVGGAIRALGQTARQSYAFDIVGPLQAVGGMAFITLGQRMGGIAGSLGAGVVLQVWGAGEAYLVIALCHLLSGAVMFLARPRGQAAPVGRWPGRRSGRA
jgi:MFS family permease